MERTSSFRMQWELSVFCSVWPAFSQYRAAGTQCQHQVPAPKPLHAVPKGRGGKGRGNRKFPMSGNAGMEKEAQGICSDGAGRAVVWGVLRARCVDRQKSGVLAEKHHRRSTLWGRGGGHRGGKVQVALSHAQVSKCGHSWSSSFLLSLLCDLTSKQRSSSYKYVGIAVLDSKYAKNESRRTYGRWRSFWIGTWLPAGRLPAWHLCLGCTYSLPIGPNFFFKASIVATASRGCVICK